MYWSNNNFLQSILHKKPTEYTVVLNFLVDNLVHRWLMHWVRMVSTTLWLIFTPMYRPAQFETVRRWRTITNWQWITLIQWKQAFEAKVYSSQLSIGNISENFTQIMWLLRLIVTWYKRRVYLPTNVQFCSPSVAQRLWYSVVTKILIHYFWEFDQDVTACYQLCDCIHITFDFLIDSLTQP